ncbi:MAG: hypothetical protein MJY50_02395 [Bacteroidales bacterium]|nr:hypothetical protein [Bacteroidales bacterium]
MIKVRILTPEWNRSLEVDAIFIPGALGEFEILPDHAPIISSLVPGAIRWRIAETWGELKVKEGTVRLDRNMLEICTEVLPTDK